MGGVTLIPEALNVADDGELFRSLDLVVIPYVHDVYREATSGIFAEALALGKPVVVPSGTWMAQELETAGAGMVFSREQPSGLADRVLEVARDMKAYAERAEASRDAWRAFHSADNLVRTLLVRARRV
jgi:glycosyltransferase involved in cell wall biosynthesis